MQTEIVTTPGDLAGMPGIPRHVRDWAFKRGERVCEVGAELVLEGGALVGGEGAEHVLGEARVAVGGGHRGLPASCMAARSLASPAAVRDFTVPMGMARMSATSVEERPSK